MLLITAPLRDHFERWAKNKLKSRYKDYLQIDLFYSNSGTIINSYILFSAIGSGAYIMDSLRCLLHKLVTSSKSLCEYRYTFSSSCFPPGKWTHGFHKMMSPYQQLPHWTAQMIARHRMVKCLSELLNLTHPWRVNRTIITLSFGFSFNYCCVSLLL